jgi:hypothetical protein
MTQQTPHARALEAAKKSTCIYENELDDIIKPYLTTLLDSPEMAEVAANAVAWHFAPSDTPHDAAKAVIAAIKKEAGIS